MKPPRLVSDWFRSKKVQIDYKVEGNLIENGIMKLGLRTYRNHHVENLTHEMAHMIEIDDARCHKQNWGLNAPTLYLCGRICDNTQTAHGAKREVRVCAIQKKMHEYLGIPFNAHYWSKLIWDFVHGALFLQFEYPELPWLVLGKNYSEVNEIRIERTAQDICDQAKKLNIDFLWKEWQHKCSIVESRL